MTLAPDLPSKETFPASDAPRAGLGALKHGLDNDSAVERLSAERSEGKTAATYPFHALDTAHEMLDLAFQEAFSAELTAGSSDLIRQAQESARAAMAELFAGNALMFLSPDDLATIEQELRELTQHVARESFNMAGRLEQTSRQPAPGQTRPARAPSAEIRRRIREQLLTQDPVRDFKFRHLGHTARIHEQQGNKEMLAEMRGE
jgi:hypothetical protein